MGKLTKLYAVSLDEVIKTVGSGDDAVLNRMCEYVASFLEDEDDDLDDDELKADHSIYISFDGKITYKQQEKTLDQICAEIIRIQSGTVEFVIEPPWNDLHDAATRAMNDVIPRSGLDRVLTRFETDDPSFDTSPNVTWTRAEGETTGGGAIEFAVSPEVMTALVHGGLQDGNPENIKAFEILCHVLGMHLPDEDHLGQIAELQLETDLAQPRCPVDLKVDPSTSGICYLTTEQVLAEALKLSKTDLTFPESEEIQEGRETLMKCLKQAAIEGSAIVGFCS